MLLSDKYPFLTNYFTELLSCDTRPFPQSILFYGSDLKSQYMLSLELSRLLNCTAGKADDCECINCRWIREGTHPAVLTVSKLDNKPADDSSKTVISIRQSQMIKEKLVSASEFHRVFIFCDRDKSGNICGLNPLNFQAETANSLLKIIEEPQQGVTFIFLARCISDLLPTIVSRSQCFFVPSKEAVNYDYSCIDGVFTDYFNFKRKDVFDISQKLTDLSKTIPAIDIMQGIQNYILSLLKANPKRSEFIKHIGYAEEGIRQLNLGMRAVNVFDELCLKLIT